MTASACGPGGVGFSYRYDLHDEILACRGLIDFLELPAEDFVVDDRRRFADPTGARLTKLRDMFPLVGHGTGLSIGSASGLPADYLARVEAWVGEADLLTYSEHLSFSRGADDELDIFCVLPFTDLGVAVAVDHARTFRARIGRPLLLENVTHHFTFAGASMGEAEFITRVLDESGSGLLLDVANLHINATNHGFDPRAFVDALPAERIHQVHYCGATHEEDGYLLDTHYERTSREIWGLLEYALDKTPVAALILERDRRYRPFNAVMDEIWRAQEILHRYRGPSPSPAAIPPPTRESRGVDSAARDMLARVQDAAIAILREPRLRRAIRLQGATALSGRGLGDEERQLLAESYGSGMIRAVYALAREPYPPPGGMR